MSTEAQSFSKGACTACAGHIEFPTEALGMTITCPHCGFETKLLANLRTAAAAAPAAPEASGPRLQRRATAAPASSPSAPQKPPAKPAAAANKFSTNCPGCGLEVSIKADTCPSCGATIRERSGLNWKVLTGSLVLLLAVGAGVFFWQNRKNGWAFKLPAIKLPSFAKKADAPAEPAAPSANPADKAAGAPQAPPKPVKRSNKFEVTDFKIERVPGRSLVYVVGNVTNDTDKQQFSVRVTFDLETGAGKNVGTATDYITVIEPGNGWQFRALILDTNATSAKLQSLEADKP